MSKYVKYEKVNVVFCFIFFSFAYIKGDVSKTNPVQPSVVQWFYSGRAVTRPPVTDTYGRQGYGCPQVYAADVHAVDGRRSGGLRDVVRVDEDQRRFDWRKAVVQASVGGGQSGRRPVVQVDGVQVEADVVQPPRERVGHAVRRQHVRYVRRVGVTAEQAGIEPRQQRPGYRVDERHAEPAGRVRHALARQRLRHEQVERVSAGRHVGGQFVGEVAHGAAGVGQERHDRRQPREHREHHRDVHIDGQQVKLAGSVHFRVIFRDRRRAFRKRRVHRDSVSAVHQRAQHAARERPVALGRHRLDGQHVRAGRVPWPSRGSH